MTTYKIGDIVNLKHDIREEPVLYIVLGHEVEKLKTGKELIAYSIEKIYPVTSDSRVMGVYESQLNLYQELTKFKHDMLIEFIIKERVREGLTSEPNWLRIIRGKETVGKLVSSGYSDKQLAEDVDEEINEPFRPITMRDVQRAYDSEYCKKRIEILLKNMDNLLDKLFVAIEKGQPRIKKSTEKKLEKIRQELTRLEHF